MQKSCKNITYFYLESIEEILKYTKYNLLENSLEKIVLKESKLNDNEISKLQLPITLKINTAKFKILLENNNNNIHAKK